MAEHLEKCPLQISYTMPELACCEGGRLQLEVCPAVPELLQLQMDQRHQTAALKSLVPLPVPRQPLAAQSSLALHPYCHVSGSPHCPETNFSLVKRFLKRISQSDKQKTAVLRKPLLRCMEQWDNKPV